MNKKTEQGNYEIFQVYSKSAPYFIDEEQLLPCLLHKDPRISEAKKFDLMM